MKSTFYDTPKKQKISAVIILLITLLIHLQLFIKARNEITFASLFLLILVIYYRLTALAHLALCLVLWRTIYLILPKPINNFSVAYFAIVFFVTVSLSYYFVKGNGLLSWFRKGNITRGSILGMIVVSVLSAAALIAWAFWTDNLGLGKEMVKGITGIPRPFVFLLLVPVFACMNAFSEEVIFRGIYQEAAIRTQLPFWLTILLPSLAFAAIHFEGGFPNGYLGYMMTFTYACALGILRHWTKGFLIPYLTHVCADLVIFYFLCFKFLP